MSYTDDIVNSIVDMLEQGTVVDGEPNRLPNVPEQDPDIQRSQMVGDMGGGEDYEDVDDAEVTDELDEAVQLMNDILDEQDNAYQTYFRGVMKKHGVTQIKTMSPDKKRAFFKDVSAGWRSRKKKVKEQTDHGIATGLNPSVSSKQQSGFHKYNIRNVNQAPKGSRSQVGKETSGGSPSGEEYDEKDQKILLKKLKSTMKVENELYEAYKKYFKFMMEECGIEDFDALTEVEQAEFMTLVNEAFMAMNELQKEKKQWRDQDDRITSRPVVSGAAPGEGYRRALSV